MTWRSRSGWQAVGALALAALGGCHVYNAGNRSLAEQVQKDYRALDVGKMVDGERKASDQVQKAEIDSARRNGEALRDNRLAMLLDLPVARTPQHAPCSAAASSLGDRGTLLCEIDTQLARVGGPRATNLEGAIERVTNLQDDVRDAIQKLTDATAGLSDGERKALPDLSCTAESRGKMKSFDAAHEKPLAGALAGGKLAGFLTLLAVYAGDEGACARLLGITSLLAGTNGGMLGSARADHLAAQKAIDDATAAAKKLTADYQKAEAAYQKASAARSDTDQARADLKAANDQVSAALSQVDAHAGAAGSALSASHVAGDPVQVAALEAQARSIAAAVRSTLANEEVIAPALLDAVKQGEQAERGRSLPVLLLASEAVRGQLEYAKAAAAAGDAQLAALADRVDALSRAYSELWLARRSLVDAGTAVCGDAEATKKVGDALGAAGCGPAVAGAMLHYANAWTVGFTPARQAQLRFIDAIEDGALAQSAASFQTWDRVLAVPIDQVAIYHSGGVKPEEVARLVIEALGFAGLISTTAIRAAQ